MARMNFHLYLCTTLCRPRSEPGSSALRQTPSRQIHDLNHTLPDGALVAPPLIQNQTVTECSCWYGFIRPWLNAWSFADNMDAEIRQRHPRPPEDDPEPFVRRDQQGHATSFLEAVKSSLVLSLVGIILFCGGVGLQFWNEVSIAPSLVVFILALVCENTVQNITCFRFGGHDL